MYDLKFWVPIVSPRPFNTFTKRWLKHLYQISWRIIFYYLLPYLGVTGARDLGRDESGLQMLRLNKRSMLGNRGTLVFVPRDFGIYESIRVNGEWQSEEIKYFAQLIDKVEESERSKEIRVVDIGANVGLWSWQLSNLFSNQMVFDLVEPVEVFGRAINENWKSKIGKKPVTVWPVALTDSDGVCEIFSEDINRGNTSLIKEAMGNSDFLTYKVRTLNSGKFFEEIYQEDSRYFIKIDTQGQDAIILGQIPDKMLKNTDAIMFEMWSLPTISEFEIDRAILALSKFREIHLWNGRPEITNLDSIRTLWLSKKSKTVDVFAFDRHFLAS